MARSPAHSRWSRCLISCLTPRVSLLRCPLGVRQCACGGDHRRPTGQHHRPRPRRPARCAHAAGVEPGRVFTENSPDRPGQSDLGWPRCSTTPAQATPWWWPRSTGWGAQSPKSPAPSPTLGERQIPLRALREGVDTATPTGRAVAAIMATLAELELELGRQRRASSRNRGAPESCRPLSLQAQPGAARTVTPARRHREPVRELATAYGIGRATAYRYLAGAGPGRP